MTTTSPTPTIPSTTSPRPHIAVLDDWEGALQALADWAPVRAQAELHFHTRPLVGPALVAALQPAQGVVLNRDRTPFDAALLAQLPALRYLVYTGPRNPRLDLAALQQRAIPVSFTEGGPALESTTEHTWALILAWARGLEAQAALMRSGGWLAQPPAPPLPLATVLAGGTLGLVGLGRIGGRMAAVARAFGMDVVTWSPHMTPERAAQHGARSVALDELLATSLVVSLHLVPAEGTRGLLNRDRLARMRADALLVNTARAELIDAPALLEALRAGRPGAAALDVWPQEPLPADAPERTLPNLLPLPHTGYVSEPVMRRFAIDARESLLAWLAGQPLPRLVGATAPAH
jgi:phosphoglycerate dehydrogenase-like enzyme